MPAFPRAANLFSLAASIALLGSASAQQAPMWNGFYAGVLGGYARDSASFDMGDLNASILSSPASVGSFKSSGGNLGLMGGANWQMGALVFGVEGDWSRYWLRSEESVLVDPSPLPGPVGAKLGAEIGWAATLRARLGFTVGNILLYGTAGGAAASAKGDLSVTGIPSPVSYSSSTILPGYVFGGGMEAMLSPNWILRGELLRLHFGGVGSLTRGVVPVTDSVDITTFRGGVAYKF